MVGARLVKRAKTPEADFLDSHRNYHHRRHLCPSAAAFLSLAHIYCFMPHSLSQKTQNKDIPRHKSAQPHKHNIQHGHANRYISRSAVISRDTDSILLDLPTESLTHITSYLDPASLFVLGGLNRRLHQHVEDDNTWRRAYAYHFLGISPEGDIQDGGSPDGTPRRALMLRREETSWKREFVFRWNLRRYAAVSDLIIIAILNFLATLQALGACQGHHNQSYTGTLHNIRHPSHAIAVFDKYIPSCAPDVISAIRNRCSFIPSSWQSPSWIPRRCWDAQRFGNRKSECGVLPGPHAVRFVRRGRHSPDTLGFQKRCRSGHQCPEGDGEQ